MRWRQQVLLELQGREGQQAQQGTTELRCSNPLMYLFQVSNHRGASVSECQT